MMIFPQSPMRAAEASLLERECLTDDSQCIVIRNGCFSHIKRDASIRLIPATPAQIAAIRNQADFMQRLGEDAKYLFLLPPSKDTRDVEGLLTLITEALQRVTGDPHARVHSFRPSATARLIAPAWETLVRSLLNGTAGPGLCSAFFGYDADKWLATATASALAGHSSRLTAISSYFGIWPLLRGAALRATMEATPCPSAYLHRHDISDDARRQAKSRAGDAFDSWAWFQQKLELQSSTWLPLRDTRATDSTTVELPDAARAMPGQSALPGLSTKVRYLALRTLGVEADIACAQLRLGHQHSQHLEGCLIRMPPAQVLRQRVKSDAVGRGARADLRWLDQAVATSWMASCPSISEESALALDVLLRREACPGIDWKDETVATRIARRALAALPIDLALEFTFGARHEKMDIRAALLTSGRVEVTAAHRDLGATPKVQVIWREESQRNDVDKARLTVLFRVLVSALVTLRSAK